MKNLVNEEGCTVSKVGNSSIVGREFANSWGQLEWVEDSVEDFRILLVLEWDREEDCVEVS